MRRRPRVFPVRNGRLCVSASVMIAAYASPPLADSKGAHIRSREFCLIYERKILRRVFS